MKTIFVAAILSAVLAFAANQSNAQNGQKWSLSGNSTGNGAFLGTTNQSPLIIKTNDEKRIKIGSNGNIKFFDFGLDANGLLSTDSSGILYKTLFNGDSNYVLTGDGSFQLAQGLIPGWKVEISNKIYSTLDYKIGIGTDTPQAILDVNGDAIIRGTLHVYDGIIIGKTYTGEKATLDTVEATKMQAEEMKADQYKTNTITIDGNNSRITSQTGEIHFDNNSLYAGSLHVNNLQVTGTITQSNLTVQNHLQIGTSSLHLSSFDQGGGTTENSIYTTNGDLLIQSMAGSNFNTIINGNNNGYVGIGTTAPQQNLHIKGETVENGVSASLSAVIRLEDEYSNTGVVSIGGSYYNRTAYWDIAASAGRKGLYFRTDQGNGGTSGIDVMRLNENGQIVMGPTENCTAIPNIKLIVDGHLLMTDGPSEEPRSIYWGYHCKPEWGLEYNATDGGLNFWNPYTSVGGLANYRLFLEDETGFVGIGTNDPEYELDVCGTIRAKEVIVDLNGTCPDFVFEDDYKLLSFEELEAYIDEFGHLPGIPSAMETKENGINVSEMNMMLLQKVEELTLYILQLESRINELENNQ